MELALDLAPHQLYSFLSYSCTRRVLEQTISDVETESQEGYHQTLLRSVTLSNVTKKQICEKGLLIRTNN